MTTRARLLPMVPILAMVALACGQKEEQAPVTTQPASSAQSVAPTVAPVVASSAVAATTTPPPPAGTAAPAVSATARPSATAAPATTQAAQPQAPPPPAAATSAPPSTMQAEKPAATPPAAPARPAAQRPKGKVTLPAKLGAVTFDHEDHAGKRGIPCATCHHPSRPQKPLSSENQACRECHSTPAAAPMKTSLQAAFHDPKAATGTCIACHKEKGGSAPVKCLECHKKK